MPVLKQGSSGPDVKTLQQKLKDPLTTLAIAGIVLRQLPFIQTHGRSERR